MLKLKPVFYVMSALILLGSAQRVHASDACTFSLVEDDAKDAAEQSVRTAVRQILDDRDVEYDPSKIEINVTSKSEPYTIQGDDGKPSQGENDSLTVKASVTTKSGTTLQMSVLNLFSVGARLVTTKVDGDSDGKPSKFCTIDFSKKGSLPTQLVNVKTGHSIGKLEETDQFEVPSRSIVNVRDPLEE